jgi:nucleoid-associated protein YgaU
MVLKSPRSFSNNKRSESGFTTTLVGIFLITVLFISYNKFLNATPTTGFENGTSKELSIIDKLKDKFAKKEDRVGVIDNMAAQDSRDETIAGAYNSRGEWIATDYTKGDIQSGQYVVKQGDTLWEIAEAVYGDGSQWHKILDANKQSVGFLPNGSQALIIIGQTLLIP